MSRSGRFFKKNVSGEIYVTYAPPQYPFDPDIDLGSLLPKIEQITTLIGHLNFYANSTPSAHLFIYTNVRKEALLSSQIEGTQSSLADLMLFDQNEQESLNIDDVEEASNYVKALFFGMEQLNANFPLSLRLIREIHTILMSGTRGGNKNPGEFRQSQNWIGGTRPGNAIFVPPSPEMLLDCLSDFENFLHNDSIPALIKIGIAHVQFESIHPFLDGNGRLGRLLIMLLLHESGLLKSPILYPSLYLKEHRSTYYQLLQEVRTHGTWETWLEFFLDSILVSAQQALETIQKLNLLFDEDKNTLSKMGRIRFSCERILELMKKLPQATVPILTRHLELSAPSVRDACQGLVNVGILIETSGKKRDRIYVYAKYLKILDVGMDPL